MSDEPRTTGSENFRFQWLFHPRVRLLRARNVDIRGEHWDSMRWSLSYTPQVLTGLRPFYHVHACTPIPAILRGERPEKPSQAESLGFSDTLWGLVQLCWSEMSSTRPTAQELLDHLSFASPKWIPPTVYPVIVTDSSRIFGLTSSGSFSTSITGSA